MVYHRDQAQFDRARWRKAVLFPLWIVQVAALLSLMGIFSYRLAETIENFEENNKQGKIPMVEVVWESTNVGLGLVSLVLTTIEVSRLFSETLTPFFMLCTHVIKITCACAILALDIVVYTQRSEGEWSLVGLAIDCALLAAMLALGIYCVATYRRLLKYDDYHHPANVKPFGYGNNQLERGLSGKSAADVSVRSAGPSPGGNNNAASTEYFSSAQGAPARSHSASSATRDVAGARGDDGGELGRRASYNHQRDTQFDEFIQRRASLSLKEDIDRALGAEFGWGGAGARGGAGGVAGVERSDSVIVGAGVVPGHVVEGGASSSGSAVRAKSWSSEQGLVAVPEGLEDAEEDDSHHHHHHQRTHSQASDRELLLGHHRDSGDAGAGAGMSAGVVPYEDVVEADSRKRRRDS